jgi:hypothetical protein
MLINIKTARDSAGNLILTANNSTRHYLAEIENWGERFAAVAEMVGMEIAQPEDVAALTDSPILCAALGDYVETEYGWIRPPQDDAEIFWYPGYMLRDPIDELKNKGRVVFDRATEA